MIELIDLRHELHRHPEISGEERITATRIVKYLGECNPSQIITELGGHGVAAIFDSGQVGETILLRCELDALPIIETGEPPYRSTVEGKGHLCGHDGHMSIMIGVAQRLAKNPITRGRIVLLFQPAEETGVGAPSVIADEKFKAIKPDFAYALHNLPGMPLGHIGVKSGPMCFASEGLKISLFGRTSHASHPEDAVSPMIALIGLIDELTNLPAQLGIDPEHALVTICHASLGEPAFGITPGDAILMAAFRAENDALQAKLIANAAHCAKAYAEQHGLSSSISYDEKFAACDNNEAAAANIKNAAENLQLPMVRIDKPFRWSEDFGAFSAAGNTALFVLGSGEDCPQLHASNYDFPDSIMITGIDMFEEIARKHCG
ncbi:amidohydrolase [Ahrensia kielensis]|uniref:Amidohydrolase n=1 Tax=Ahrensia kielensis TaxID=76980 RepID=A0ABU9T5G1_9HYPH